LYRRFAGRLLAIAASFSRATAAEAANLDHVTPVDADLLSTLSPGVAGLFSREFVGGAFAVRCHSAFAGDFALFIAFHRGKSAGSCLRLHGKNPFSRPKLLKAIFIVGIESNGQYDARRQTVAHRPQPDTEDHLLPFAAIRIPTLDYMRGLALRRRKSLVATLCHAGRHASYG
jgi:hypothetical protein